MLSGKEECTVSCRINRNIGKGAPIGEGIIVVAPAQHGENEAFWIFVKRNFLGIEKEFVNNYPALPIVKCFLHVYNAP